MNKFADGMEDRGRILLVDDDPIVLESLGELLTLEGYDVLLADSARAATGLLDAEDVQLVISDVSMPEIGGLELLEYVRRRHPDVVVMLMTGYGTIESAVGAIKQGAYDYLTKPIVDDDVRMAVERALRQQALLAENSRLKQQLTGRYSFENIVSADRRMLRVFELIDAVAETRTTVLILGESGTGKSMLARAIHARSDRAAGPFVEVSCGALPENLLESELFGHVAGAFTGATRDKPGKFTAATGGTIFLDEIAAASPALQVKLLRVLQERRYEPVGSNETHTADARVILAANVDLAAEVEAGRFRQDLYYRVNVVTLDLPPLRERPADVLLLAEHFLQQFCGEHSRQVRGFSHDAMATMQRYAWPGNVRELENCVERSVLLCDGAEIDPDDLPAAVREAQTQPPTRPAGDDSPTLGLAAAMEQAERQFIVDALARNDGNRNASAEQLQIDRTTLYKKMKKLGLLDEF